MPSTTDYLRNKFMENGDDGIGKAEKIIQKYGGLISKTPTGFIDVPIGIHNTHPSHYQEFWDAIQFLCEEWDYAIL